MTSYTGWPAQNTSLVPGCTVRLLSSANGRGRQRKDGLRHRPGTLPVQCDALWTEECPCYVPAVHVNHLDGAGFLLRPH